MFGGHGQTRALKNADYKKAFPNYKKLTPK
jgi:hypothetical protein